ncbi:MAG: hypothetical protein Q8R15_02920 [Candidatus Micrarchaeota archaeon]|nr:hypothetical protein [Candidatus Micrarchaeota archaeon]
MDIDIPEWSKLAEIEWSGQPLVLLQRDDTVLMLLAEKRLDRTIGFACAACKPFVVKGDAAKLDLVKFSNEVTLVKKLNASTPESFLLAFTKPSYVQFSQNAISQAANLHVKQLQELNYEVKNMASVTLGEVENGSNPLLGDPALLFSFLSMLRSAVKAPGLQSVVGLNLAGEKVSCSIPSVSLGLTVGGTKPQRMHVLHLLCEEVMQQNGTVVVFDTNNSFAGLSRPSGAELTEFTAFSMPGLAAGFPVHEVIPGKNAFVKLSEFTPAALTAPFGLTGSDIAPYVEKAFQSGSMELLNEANATNGLNQFTALRVNRVVKVMQQCFQGVFASNSNVEFSHSLGKMLHINLSKCSEEAKAFFSLGLLKQLEKSEGSIFIVFEQDAKEIKTLVEFSVNKFLGSNVSILCHSEDENDVPFVNSADFFVEILDKDVAITLAGKSPQRVKLRPTYSACSEN